MDNKPKDYFDFKEDVLLKKSFSADYLRQYYHPNRPVTDDESAVYQFILSISAKLSNITNCLEVGCGPTLHHAIMLAPFVRSMDLADYLEENLAFVDAWIKDTPGSWDWSTYTKFCLQQEGIEPTVETINFRENLTRKRIGTLHTINLLSEFPLTKANSQYDLIAAFYCTEEIALTQTRWHEVLRSTSSLIKPGGYLLISCLENTDFYHIQSENGSLRKLPCAQITQDSLEESLKKLGFDMAKTQIEVKQTPNQAGEGVSGVILALALKI